MSISPGTPKQLGPYEILSPLGAGGMGEVYRAKDTRLGREVAVKILRGDIASDADRKARFEREAQVVAGLSHPNIVALFEVGSADGVEYTVSELVDGQSLRSLLQQEGAVPVRRVVELALQMADGMAAAHAAGIVHRDLKPENVMVTRDGRVKILDFGLARQVNAFGGAGASSASSSSETMLAPAQTLISSAPTEYRTSPGMVLGTAAYMSPEQAKGLEADYHSDQFSFGLMVYEMLAGRQAFVRGSAVETMAAIVRDEPEPISEIDNKMPVTLRWIVERCLEKDPGQRFDSTKDLYQQLRMLRDHFSEAFSSSLAPVSRELGAAQAPAKSRPSAAFWIAALLAGLALGAGATWLLKPSGVDLAKYKYATFAVNASTPIWSPDGKMAAYSGSFADGSELFLRALNSNTPQQLTHAGGEVRPLSWSADSSHIYYLASLATQKDVNLMSIATVGGEPDTLWVLPMHEYQLNMALTISPDGKAAVWLHRGADGQYDIYVSEPLGSPVRRYPNSGVASRDVYNGPKLQFSPNGKQILLIRAGDSNSEEAWLLPWPAGSGKSRQVMRNLPREGGTTPVAWMPDNRHVVLSGTTDIASGSHLFLADTQSDSIQQITQGTGSEGTMSVAPDGALLFTEARGQSDIISMSVTDGTVKPLIVTGMHENMPAWALHANAMVYASTRLGPQDIWLHTEDGAGNATERPLITRQMFGANPPKWIFAPVLSPDGQRVIFIAVPQTAQTGKAAIAKLWEASVAGGAPVPLIDASDPDTQFAGDWSPDGSRFAYIALHPDGKASLNIVRTSGGAKPEVILLADIGHALPSWSPDGQWIYYMDDKDVSHLISADSAKHRSLGKMDVLSMGWAKDSKTLYGIRDDGGKHFVFSLDVSSDPARLHDIKQIDASLLPNSNLQPSIRYTLAPDGKSFAYATRKSERSLWMLTGWQ